MRKYPLLYLDNLRDRDIEKMLDDYITSDFADQIPKRLLDIARSEIITEGFKGAESILESDKTLEIVEVEASPKTKIPTHKIESGISNSFALSSIESS